MAKAKELREKQVPLYNRMAELRDKAHSETGWTAEERANWEAVNKDYDKLGEQIDIAERTEKIEGDLAKPKGQRDVGREDRGGKTQRENAGASEDITDEMRALAFQGWCRSQMEMDLRDEHVEACEEVGLNPNKRKLSIRINQTRQAREMQRRASRCHQSQIEERALSGVSGTGGQYTIPMGFVQNLEVALLQFGGIRVDADVMRTTSGEDMPWPTSNDTGNKGRLIGENTTVDTTGATTAAPTFGATIMRAYKFTSDAILVPTELLEDSAFDLATTLGQMLGERIGRIQADYFTTGTGASQPKGAVTAATLGITAASPTAIAADEILKLIHSVDPAYRNGAVFQMHDNTLLTIRLLKDGQGRYLWSAGLTDNVPDRLSGYKLTVNQSMDSTVATTKKTIAFGQFKKYKIRDVKDVRLYRLEERYRDADQDGFVAFMRGDGNLLDAGTHPIKYLQQA